MNKPVKKHLRTIITTAAAGALLVVPAGSALAGNNHHGSNNHNWGNDQQRSARQFSRERGERSYDNGWWNDWRFGDGRQDWESRPRTCEQRQAKVSRESDRLKRSANEQWRKIGWQVDYQKWYVSHYQLAPEGYDEVVASAATNKTEAKAAIDALSAPTIDCEQPEDNDKVLLQQNKGPVLAALRDYHIDAVTLTYAVQAAK